MITGKVRVVTPPDIEPVTLAEVTTQAHASVGVEDDWFTDQIVAARQIAEEFMNRAFIEQVLEVTYDDYPYFPILVPTAPVISIDQISIFDTDNTESILYTSSTTTPSPTTGDLTFNIDVNTEPARIDLDYGLTWPSTVLRDMSSVKIQYTAGYGDSADDVPSRIKSAIKLFVSHMYDNRNGELGIPDSFYNLLRPDRFYIGLI